MFFQTSHKRPSAKFRHIHLARRACYSACFGKSIGSSSNAGGFDSTQECRLRFRVSQRDRNTCPNPERTGAPVKASVRNQAEVTQI
jgi:hypothetical protein